jgi:UDP-glucose 6-dehydrogenase
MREAPSTQVVPLLLASGATVVGFDPKAYWPDATLTQVDSISAAIKDADVVMALVEWPEIVSFDFAQATHPAGGYFIDARNQFDPQDISSAGYTYLGVGRS